MTNYGIQGLRNDDGRLNRVEDYKTTYRDFDAKVTFEPPPGDVLEDMQTMREEDVSIEKVREWVDEYIIKPTIPEDEDWTLPEMVVFIMAMIRWGNGVPSGYDDDSEDSEETLEEQRQEAIDARTSNGEGN